MLSAGSSNCERRLVAVMKKRILVSYQCLSQSTRLLLASLSVEVSYKVEFLFKGEIPNTSLKAFFFQLDCTLALSDGRHCKALTKNSPCSQEFSWGPPRSFYHLPMYPNSIFILLTRPPCCVCPDSKSMLGKRPYLSQLVPLLLKSGQENEWAIWAAT